MCRTFQREANCILFWTRAQEEEGINITSIPRKSKVGAMCNSMRLCVVPSVLSAGYHPAHYIISPKVQTISNTYFISDLISVHSLHNLIVSKQVVEAKPREVSK
jgi:hypothetical protein